MAQPRTVIPIQPTAANSAPTPRHHLYPALAAWRHAEWFKAAAVGLLVVGVASLTVFASPLLAVVVGVAVVVGAFTVAEILLRRIARREGAPVRMSKHPPVSRTTWALLASVMLFGAAFAVSMGLDRQWFAAVVGGVLFPAGAVVDWLFLRRSSPEAARVADYGLTYLMTGLLLLGWFTGAWERLP
jgi:hypothetical protein